MAGVSYPFDSGPGANLTEDQWSNMMRDAVGNGVHENGTTPGPSSNELLVFSLGEPGIVYLNAGRASVEGFHYQQGGTEVLTVTPNASASQDRIDAVVLRLDLTTNAITLETKLGALAASPVPPSIASNELLLATYRVRKNSSSVIQHEVTDARRFIGRRMLVTGIGGQGQEGDLEYSPSSGMWFGNTPGGFVKPLAFKEALDNHIAAVDPHPQYMTQAETNTTVTTSTISLGPTMSLFAAYCRALNLPGGFKVVNLYFYGRFNGVDNVGAHTLCTIPDTSMRPNFLFRFVGHQWKFTNSTDDMPLIVGVDTDGSVSSTGQTFLMGGANVLFNATYFTGSGV